MIRLALFAILPISYQYLNLLLLSYVYEHEHAKEITLEKAVATNR